MNRSGGVSEILIIDELFHILVVLWYTELSRLTWQEKCLDSYCTPIGKSNWDNYESYHNDASKSLHYVCR